MSLFQKQGVTRLSVLSRTYTTRTSTACAAFQLKAAFVDAGLHPEEVDFGRQQPADRQRGRRHGAGGATNAVAVSRILAIEVGLHSVAIGCVSRQPRIAIAAKMAPLVAIFAAMAIQLTP